MTDITPELSIEDLENVITRLFKMADDNRKNSESYQDMFKASEHGIRGLLDEANDKMGKIV